MALPKHEALSEDKMRDVVREYVKEKGTLVAAAESLSTSPSHLSEIISGQRSIGDSIAAQFGFEKQKIKVCHQVPLYVGSRARMK